MKKPTHQLLTLALPILATAGAMATTGTSMLQRAATSGTGDIPTSTSHTSNVAGIRAVTPMQKGFSVVNPITPKPATPRQSPLMIPGSEPAYGCMVWNETWSSGGGFGGGSFEYGIYSVPTNGNTTFGLQAKDQKFRASRGAVYTPKYYLTAVPTEMMGITFSVTFNLIDPVNWQTVKTVTGDAGFNSPCMAYDPTSGITYGFFAEPDGSWYFGTFDFETCDYSVISQLDTSKPQWQAMVIDNAGDLFAFDIAGDLLKVDKGNGAATTVGNMGITPQHATSAAYNPRNGKCYYSLCSDTSNGLYEVNMTTGKATKIIDYANNEEFLGMFFYLDDVADGAPAAATGLAAEFQEASLSGNIAFDIPATTFSGTDGTGDVRYEIYCNGEKASSGTSTFGAHVKAPVSVAEAGNYTFSVVLGNDDGKSEISYLKAFVGEDTPSPATGLDLSYADGKFNLSWDAAKGVNGGYLDTDNIAYRVTRYPEATVVADNHKETSLSDEVPVPDGLTAYRYTVEVLYKGTATSPSSTGEITLGNIVPPYKEDFDNGDSFGQYTVINVDNDYSSWSRNSGGYVTIETGYGQKKDNNDWLILPAIKVEKGMMYDFSFDTKAQSEKYPEICEAKLGAAPTAEAMGTTVIEQTSVTSTEWVTLRGSFIAEETGVVYIGIRNSSSAATGYRQYVDNISVSAPVSPASPGPVTDLVITPAADGSLSATLEFTAPSVSSEGQPLSDLQRVAISRNGVETASIDATPGQRISYADTNADGGIVNGPNTYRLVPYNATGAGTPVEVSQYIGFATPCQVTNVVARTATDTGKAVISWDAVTEDINGTTLPSAKVEYIVTRVENNELIDVYTGSGLTFTDNVTSATAQQTFVYYGVQAKILDYKGEYGTSNLTPVGKPYTTPWQESFAGGDLHYIWGISASDNSYWTILGDTDASNLASFDHDGGMLVMTGENVTSDDVADIFSGSISLADTETPGLTFYCYGYDSRNTLSVLVDAGNGMETVSSITLSQSQGWTKHTVDLARYAGKNVQIGFRGQVYDNPLIAVDNIRVGTLYDHDLTSVSISGPARVDPDKEFKIAFSYRNEGTLQADGYDVTLYRNGEPIETIAGTTLAPGTGTEVEFATKMSVIDPEQSKYEARLQWSKEQNETDNSSDITISLRLPAYPVVSDLSAVRDGNEVELTWSDPDVSLAPDVTTTDDVEGYPAFSNGMADSEIPDDSLGDWTVIDRDNAPTYSIDGYYFPNQNAKMSWMAFNTYDAGVENLLPANSGEQMLVCFAARGTANDDWLVSPELSGKAQTISFQAKTGAPQYGSDHYELYYSTTGKDVADFILVADVADVPGRWTEYEYALPEGAKYFAIRCISDNTFALCIDDVKYTEAGAEQLALSIVGYNIYRDGVSLNSEPVVDTSWTDTTLAADRPAEYVVTVVYDLGESAASNKASVGTLGLDSLTGGVLITTRDGNLVIRGGEGLGVSVFSTSGITVWSGLAEHETIVPLEKGVYVVTVGTKTVKTVI